MLNSIKSSPKKWAIAAACTIIVLIIGIAFIVSRAGGQVVSVEAELGTATGGISVGSDLNASANRYAQFAAAAINPTPSSATLITDSQKREIAMMLVSSAENSSLDWRAQYGYIEYNVEGNAAENRGYTGGIIGFTSKTGDMYEMVKYYDSIAPNNPLSPYVNALKNVNGTSSTSGLGTAFVNAWHAACGDPSNPKASFDQKCHDAQDYMRDKMYLVPAVNGSTLNGVRIYGAKEDGLGILGQFIYYDAMVMHGYGDDSMSEGGIRAAALKKAKTPAQGGDEYTYLKAFLAARKTVMLAEEGHSDTSRIDTEQTKFLEARNFNLDLPLSWSVYGDPYNLTQAMLDKYMSTGSF